MIYGAAAKAEIELTVDGEHVLVDLMQGEEDLAAALQRSGVPVASVSIDTRQAGPSDLRSVFVALTEPPTHPIRLTQARAWTADTMPLMVRAEVTLPDPEDEKSSDITEIVGFLENRHAVVLRPGQTVRGSISDPRSGTDVVFEASVLERDFSTVDTKELGIRLGSQSLAAKIIKRGVISQVVVGVDDVAAAELAELPGAVVHLSFPLARQSLFAYLLARDAAI